MSWKDCGIPNRAGNPLQKCRSSYPAVSLLMLTKSAKCFSFLMLTKKYDRWIIACHGVNAYVVPVALHYWLCYYYDGELATLPANCHQLLMTGTGSWGLNFLGVRLLSDDWTFSSNAVFNLVLKNFQLPWNHRNSVDFWPKYFLETCTELCMF